MGQRRLLPRQTLRFLSVLEGLALTLSPEG